ncbi:hypothetical protein [Kribbella sp. NPDC006257]|uniref:hypothetical protein n=1 Tax=Kribbella sp. NPDC006257 TaxID=3156738 RepID=UPI0033BE4F30
MTVKARLDGDGFDLETVGRIFNGGDVRVLKDSNGYYLTSPALDAVAAKGGGVELLEVAQDHVLHINGAARALNSGYKPIRATGRFNRPLPDGGEATEVVLSVDSIMMRSTIGTPTISIGGVVVQPPPSPAQRWVELAPTNPDVRDMLSYLGRAEDDLSWDDLWKVFEIVRAAAAGGSNPALVATGWVTADDLDAFFASANDPAVSGEGARHARHRPRGKPSRAMPIHEGREFARKLAKTWLETL